MSEFGDLLERVLDPRFECVSARVSTSIDIEGRRRLLEQHGARVGVLSVGGDPDAPPPTTIDSVVDIWFHRDGRYRIDHGGNGHSTFGDGRGHVMLRPDRSAIRIDRPGSDMGSERAVIEPAALVSSYLLEAEGTEEISGRECVLVRGRRRASADVRMGPMRLWFPPTASAELVFDRETGVLLRFAGIEAGTTIATLMTSDVAFDDDVDLHAFDLPPGTEVRTEAEDQLQQMADEGVDVSAIDATDAEAVLHRFIEHRRAKHGFPPPPDRRTLHQPTGPPPADEESARQQITDAFEHLTERDDDGGAVNIQGGGNLGPSLDRAAATYPGTATVTVNDVLFLDDRQAVVWFTVTVENGPTVSPEGRALLIGGRWVAARETMGSLLSMAGIVIPPPE